MYMQFPQPHRLPEPGNAISNPPNLSRSREHLIRVYLPGSLPCLRFETGWPDIPDLSLISAPRDGRPLPGRSLPSVPVRSRCHDVPLQVALELGLEAQPCSLLHLAGEFEAVVRSCPRRFFSATEVEL